MSERKFVGLFKRSACVVVVTSARLCLPRARGASTTRGMMRQGSLTRGHGSGWAAEFTSLHPGRRGPCRVMWFGFVAQVRDRYLAGELSPDEFRHDLEVACRLDEGILEPDEVVPTYLVDRNGFAIAFTAAGLTQDAELLAESA